MLDDLAATVGELLGREGRQTPHIGDNHTRLPKGAGEVFAGGQVDGRLAAHRRIHHGEQACGNLHKLAAAHVGGGHKARHVAHDAAAERHDHIGARKLVLGNKLQNGNVGLGALMGLAGLEGADTHLVTRGLQALLNRHLVERTYVGVRHDDGARAAGGGAHKLARLLQQKRAHMHLVGACSVDIDGNRHKLRSFRPGVVSGLVGGLVVERALDAVALGKEVLQIALIAVLKRAAVGAERLDQMVDLEGESVSVVNHELGPHLRVEMRHAGEVAVAAGRKAVVDLGGRAFDVGVGDDVRKLACKGNHAVVLGGAGHAELAKAQGTHHLAHLAQKLQLKCIVHRGRNEHERRALEQVGARVRVARELRACHGVRAHKVKAVLAGELKGALAHDALDAHGVDDHGAHDGFGVGGVGERLGVRLEPLDAGLGVAGQDDDVALAERLLVECAGNGAHAGGRHDIIVGVPRQYADARLRIAAGKAAADQSQAYNAGALGAALVNACVSHRAHCYSMVSWQTTSRMARMRRMVSSNWSGVRAWAPSDQARLGSSWTSISRPLAPQAVAASAMGST